MKNKKIEKRNCEFEPTKIKLAWGKYAMFFSYDENHRACKPEDAYWIHIHVFTAKGKFICDTIGFGPKGPVEKPE
ncbi:MAG: hypothetical protein K2H82_00755 [Oscillospiraceae bacterium]|nr:hypothetical protein [Oscillospiraceae bacterium]